MIAIMPIPAVVPLDANYQYKPSVKTGLYCCDCRHEYGDPKHCPGCKVAGQHKHFQGKADRGKYSDYDSRRPAPIHHFLGKRRRFSKGILSAE